MKRFKFKRTYFAMPYAVLGALFVIGPLGIMAVYAFTDTDGSFTFSNFVNFFSKPAMIKVLFRSLGVAAITTVACLLLAPAVLPPAGPGEVGMPGEVLTGSEQPGADDGGEDGIRPCVDWEDDKPSKFNQ